MTIDNKDRAFTPEQLKKVEDHIKRCREEVAIIMAEHSTKHTTKRIEYNCEICGDPLYTEVNRGAYIDYENLICPNCKDKMSVAILNIRLD